MAADEGARAIIADSMMRSCNFSDEQRDQLVNEIKARYGNSLRAILIYGSYLRGKRDTLLDFYVLIDDYRDVPGRVQAWLGRALPPNVYQICCGQPPREVRAKYALMTLRHFEDSVRTDFHSYFWARFAQPCGLIYCVDASVGERLGHAIEDATLRFIDEVIPVLEAEFGWRDLWSRGLSLTYQCELRSEPSGHADQLVEQNAPYYEKITAALASEDIGLRQLASGQFSGRTTPAARRWTQLRWRVRRIQGKVLSVLRIVKASLTFDDALDYLLWKIGRHSSIYIEPSPRQRKYPVLFAWPLLWRLYRRGAFR